MANAKKSKGNVKGNNKLTAKGASSGSSQKKTNRGDKMSAKVAKKSASQKEVSVKLEKENRQDIIKLILEDHKPLKKLIKILKNHDLDINDRQAAFDEFAPLFVNHTKPEEMSLYVYMKDEDDLRDEGFEGSVEHALAERLVAEIKDTDNDDLWSARVKVLADVVERHLEEEENTMLPDFKKYSELEDRIQLGQAYLHLKSEYESMGGRDTVAEDAMEIHPNH